VETLGEELASETRALQIIALVMHLPICTRSKLVASLQCMPTRVAARSLVNLEATLRGRTCPHLRVVVQSWRLSSCGAGGRRIWELYLGVVAQLGGLCSSSRVATTRLVGVGMLVCSFCVGWLCTPGGFLHAVLFVAGAFGSCILMWVCSEGAWLDFIGGDDALVGSGGGSCVALGRCGWLFGRPQSSWKTGRAVLQHSLVLAWCGDDAHYVGASGCSCIELL
jgi:hypothetical protein